MTKSKDPADAVGLRVMLVAVPATFQGKPCMAIRIRAADGQRSRRNRAVQTRPGQPVKTGAAKRGRPPGKKSAAEEMDDNIPFTEAGS